MPHDPDNFPEYKVEMIPAPVYPETSPAFKMARHGYRFVQPEPSCEELQCRCGCPWFTVERITDGIITSNTAKCAKCDRIQ